MEKSIPQEVLVEPIEIIMYYYHCCPVRLRTALALMQLENVILEDSNEMVKELLSEQILLNDCFATEDYQLNIKKPTHEQICMVLENEVISTPN